MSFESEYLWNWFWRLLGMILTLNIDFYSFFGPKSDDEDLGGSPFYRRNMDAFVQQGKLDQSTYWKRISLGFNLFKSINISYLQVIEILSHNTTPEKWFWNI